MKQLLLTATALLLLCGTASAQGWEDCESERASSSVGNGGVLCFALDENDTVLTSNMVDFNKCRNGVTIWISQDTSGGGTTRTWSFYSCLTSTVSANCCQVVATGMSDAGTNTIAKKHIKWGYAVLSDTPAAGETPRLMAVCE